MPTTKIELQQANTRLANENDALRHQVSQLQADLLRITECASAINTLSRSTKERVTAMLRAKEQALATGVCVKAF